MPWKLLNQSWMTPSAIFVAAAALQNKFPLSSKFSINPGNMPKTYTYFLSTSGKDMAGFLVKSSRGRCESTALMDASRWPSTNCIPAQKIASVSTESNHNCSALVLDSDNGVCCHHSSAYSLYIRVLQTTTRGTYLTCEAISPVRKTHFANNEKIIYLRITCWFSRMQHITKKSHFAGCSALELLCHSSCGSPQKNVERPSLYEWIDQLRPAHKRLTKPIIMSIS